MWLGITYNGMDQLYNLVGNLARLDTIIDILTSQVTILFEKTRFLSFWANIIIKMLSPSSILVIFESISLYC